MSSHDPVNSTNRLPDDSEHSSDQRELVLVKNGRRYVFFCAQGQEASLLQRLGEMAGDPNVDLSWFDAAVLSHQVGRRLEQRLVQVRKP